jgi:hypothetical protein
MKGKSTVTNEKAHLNSISFCSMYIKEYELDSEEEAILNELIEFFDGEEYIIQRWFSKKRTFNNGKFVTALEIIKTGEGRMLIHDYISRLKNDDFSSCLNEE